MAGNWEDGFDKGGRKAVVPKSLVNKIQSVFFEGLPFGASVSKIRTDEFHLVRAVLQMLQVGRNFLQEGRHVLEITSDVKGICEFCIFLAELLKWLRCLALKEQMNKLDSSTTGTPTLLGFANALSNLCSGAEDLLDLVHKAIPCGYFNNESLFPACDVAVHILNFLYKKLDED
ncbi:hypothetical protein GIB67_032583 [Kingdonia uniflora]|uniref:Uncharacterized protein n=1 Tax=Kingdonia uniflora TaxID=39325 RepID=A0A7J7LSD7_9MAGN|nr:hypothetical protein GIB67_032583 [Kingdonia uniflora]